MTFRLGDDGELEPVDADGKLKRKRKVKDRGWLRGCARIFRLGAFEVRGLIGGFALFFLPNPNNAFTTRNLNSGKLCQADIKMISVAAASVLFQSPNSSSMTERELIILDGHTSAGIGRLGQVDSLNLASDGK